MEKEKWIHVHTDERGLWTADLYEGVSKVKNIGGSYPKSQSVTNDALMSWGRLLTVRVGLIGENK